MVSFTFSAFAVTVKVVNNGTKILFSTRWMVMIREY